jgi:hypothetical protein
MPSFYRVQKVNRDGCFHPHYYDVGQFKFWLRSYNNNNNSNNKNNHMYCKTYLASTSVNPQVSEECFQNVS